MAIITERTGDIFSAPPNTILIHACNAKGVWGSGVALAFKKNYPEAYKTYRAHCLRPPPSTSLPAHQRAITGTTLLIPLPPSSSSMHSTDPAKRTHHIACLITSLSYGRSVSKPEIILQNTAAAMRDLEARMEGLEGKGECWAVKINSGRFGVGWERTRRVLEGGGIDLVVLGPEGEEGGETGVKREVTDKTSKENGGMNRKRKLETDGDAAEEAERIKAEDKGTRVEALGKRRLRRRFPSPTNSAFK